MQVNRRAAWSNTEHASGQTSGFILGWCLAGLLACSLFAIVRQAAAQTEGEDPGVVLPAVVEGEIVLPAQGRVVGLTWMGSDSLAVLMEMAASRAASGERQTHLVFQGVSGEVWRQEDFSGVLDRGLAWDGESLWSCGDADDGSSILYKIGVDSLRVWQVKEAYDTPGHRPSDLCFDGRFIWLSDRDSGRVDRFDPAVEEITRSVLTPGFSPNGLAWDGSNMWLTDTGTGLLYRLSGSRRTWSATVDPDAFMHRGEDVLLAAAGGGLWFVAPGANRVQRLRFQ